MNPKDQCRQFASAERFGDVVVGTDRQTDQLVDSLAPCGQQNHGHVGLATQLAEHLDSVGAGHHDVAHDEVRLQLAREEQGALTVCGVGDLVAVLLR